MSIQERSEIHLSEIAYSRGSTMAVYEILLDGSRSCPQHECSEIRISKISYLHTRPLMLTKFSEIVTARPPRTAAEIP
jgi:hypothetical protein